MSYTLLEIRFGRAPTPYRGILLHYKTKCVGAYCQCVKKVNVVNVTSKTFVKTKEKITYDIYTKHLKCYKQCYINCSLIVSGSFQ